MAKCLSSVEIMKFRVFFFAFVFLKLWPSLSWDRVLPEQTSL